MAKVESRMLALGTIAPDFYLDDVISGKKIGVHDFKDSKGIVIMFICNHCPYVKHTIQGIIDLASDYQRKGVQFLAINANDITQYPDDAPEFMKQVAEAHDYPFPYLFDATQEVAKAY